ncbi:T9SS type A sorting domain-containing protein [Pedobacter nanyangensis]|uniref:T9SS type A sorting domain-containing protein n=1 Tax=Pedobacter nanyangensis TaxID=1562389 RepID=UPI001F068D21|nr:T9SS type A sorting domain-containing protein [Pedobacter nanyangensis]
MKAKGVKIALKSHMASLTVMLLLLCSAVFAQKADTSRISVRPKTKPAAKFPTIKGSVQPYRPNIYNYLPATNPTHNAPVANKEKGEKNLTILKIYPNPVLEQLNINLRLDKETSISIKITDLLGNDIVTLANERLPHGEHTKTYNMPSKLNAGIYFLRIVAGGEPVIKRISVL